MATEPSAFVYHAWLASAALPPGTVNGLLKKYGTPENVWNAVISGPSIIDGIPAAGLKTLKQNMTDEWLETVERLLFQHQIGAFTITDQDYPSMLLQMEVLLDGIGIGRLKELLESRMQSSIFIFQQMNPQWLEPFLLKSVLIA